MSPVIETADRREAERWSGRAWVLVGALAAVGAATAVWASLHAAEVVERMVASGLLPPALGQPFRAHRVMHLVAFALAGAGLGLAIVRRMHRASRAALVLELNLEIVGLLLWLGTWTVDPVLRHLWGLSAFDVREPLLWIAYLTGRAVALVLGPLAFVARLKTPWRAHQAILIGCYAAVVSALLAGFVLRSAYRW